jgi:hypothetical protein
MIHTLCPYLDLGEGLAVLQLVEKTVLRCALLLASVQNVLICKGSRAGLGEAAKGGSCDRPIKLCKILCRALECSVRWEWSGELRLRLS